MFVSKLGMEPPIPLIEKADIIYIICPCLCIISTFLPVDTIKKLNSSNWHYHLKQF